MDDLPVREEVPVRSVAFAPRAIRSRGPGGLVALGVWLVGFAAVVVVGLQANGATRSATPVSTEPISATRAADVVSLLPSVPRLPSTYMGAKLLGDVIELDAPAPARVEVTTRLVAVAGVVHVRADRVGIYLEARGNRVLDQATVDVSDPHGGIRPVVRPRFRATFDLAGPRPNGTMWIVVTAYDERGMPLGGTRRPFTVGPLLEPQPVGADSGRGQG